MGPSQDNSFGSFNPGGTNPGSFGSGTQMGQPIASGIGDIVLDNDTATKKPKKAIIVLAILAALLVLAGVGFLIWNGVGSGSPANLKTSFNKFANYMYVGEESDAVLPEVAEDDIFEFQSMLYADDATERNQYFTTAGSLLGDVELALSKNTELSQELRAKMQSMVEHANLIIKVGEVPLLSDDELTVLYLEAGNLAAADTEVDNMYAGWTSSNNEGLSQYGNDLLLVYKDTLRRLDQLNSAGCLKNSEIDQTCAKKVKFTNVYSDQELGEIFTKIQSFGDELESIKGGLEAEISTISTELGEGNK